MLRLAPLLAIALLVGCSDADTPSPTPTVPTPPTPSASAAPDSVDAMPQRPATIEETISIEGMDETVILSLVEFPDFRLPFSTYVRDGWESESTASGEGEAAILTFGPSAVHVFVPAGDLSMQETMEIASAAAESRGNAVALEPEGWSQGGFAFANDVEGGQVRVGLHDGVSFYILESYTPEMGDGFVPAARVILDQWRWADGTGL